jgi:hypothetical protein
MSRGRIIKFPQMGVNKMKKFKDRIKLAVLVSGEVGVMFKILCAKYRLPMNSVMDVWIRRCLEIGNLDDVWAQLKAESDARKAQK